jgi:tetratricopeptide (TPR) repeat protein
MISQWVSTTILAFSLLGQAAPQEEPQAAPQEEPQAAPTVATIEQSIEELGHSSYRVRHDAMKRLWAMGDAAEDALVQALKSPDREVRSRATWALDRIQLGIGPDTPPEILIAFERFRYGNITEKQAVLQQLATAKNFQILFRFILSIDDAAVRAQLSRPFWTQFDRLAAGLLEDGNFDEYEDTLKWGIKTDTSTRGASYRVRQLVVFWHLRGSLDNEMIAVKKRAEDAVNRSDQHLVAYGHYLKEEFDEALVWAKKAAEPDLISDIYLRQRDWKKLLELSDIGHDGVELLGFKAVFYRKLGDAENLEKTLIEIEKMADESSSQLWFCGEALLVNGEPERAIELFKKSEPPTIAFQLLCYQGRFAEAFDLVGLKDVNNSTGWYKDLLEKNKEAAEQRKKVHPIAIEVGRRLFNLNQKQNAEKLFDAIATAVSNKENADQLRSLAKTELTLGLYERALDHSAKAIELEPKRTNSVIWALHPKDYQTAWSWWQVIQHQNKQATHRERLEKLHELFYPEDEAATKKQLAETTAAALKYVEQLPTIQQATLLKAIADLCKHFESVELTEKYLLVLGEKFPDAKTWMELAGLYAEHERWREAAKMYRAAWNADKLKAGSLYLEGYALSKLGSNDGERLMTLAKIVPLANAKHRRDLATDLDNAGLKQHALEQWRTITRFGSPPALTGEFAWTVSYANRQIGNAINEEDPATAADHWERWLIYLLRTQSSFTEPNHYLSIPHLVAKSRAKGFIKEKKFVEAVAAINHSQAYVPLEVNLPIEVVPLLDEAGQHEAANELFQKSFGVHQKILDDFPTSALHLNNAAWLAANCNRRLDKALEFALKATEVAPERASYIDTLGEVYFRKGDRENAVKNAKRCIELDPSNEFYPKQLRRFQDDPIPVAAG